MFSFLRPGAAPARPSVSEVAKLVAEGKVLMIDVREVAEARASGIAEGARLVPLSVLPLKADPHQPDCVLPQGLPIVAYCAAGARSARAAEILGRMGYAEVSNLGGLGDWAADGGRVVPYKG